MCCCKAKGIKKLGASSKFNYSLDKIGILHLIQDGHSRESGKGGNIQEQ